MAQNKDMQRQLISPGAFSFTSKVEENMDSGGRGMGFNPSSAQTV